MKSSMLQKRRKRREAEIYKLLGEILSKERNEISISNSAKSNVWHHPYLSHPKILMSECEPFFPQET
jgi:hypothetical protein